MQVALTGGVASGKSTVASVLRELGAVVIDSDQLAREVVEPGTTGLAAVLDVDVPVETQVERMVRERDWSREDAEARVRAQATREQRRAVATYVLDNAGTRDDLRDQVTEVVGRLRAAG